MDWTGHQPDKGSLLSPSTHSFLFVALLFFPFTLLLLTSTSYAYPQPLPQTNQVHTLLISNPRRKQTDRMPSVDETTPLWEQGAVHNTNHLGEHQQDEHDDNDNLTTPLLRHNTVELGPPADPYRISYWIMVIQGASMLLPWNGACLNASSRVWRKGHCLLVSLLTFPFLQPRMVCSVHHGTEVLQVEVYRIAL